MTAEAIDCAYSVAGEGPPLFLIHGIGAARNTWAKLMPLLTSHYTVVTYDLRDMASHLCLMVNLALMN